MRRLLAAVAGILFCGTAAAQTGADLLRYCRSDNPAEFIGCELYVAGFVQGFSSSRHLSDKICLPEDLTGDRATSVFVQFLHEIEVSSKLGRTPAPAVNPFFTADQGASLSAVLGMTFPCPK